MVNWYNIGLIDYRTWCKILSTKRILTFLPKSIPSRFTTPLSSLYKFFIVFHGKHGSKVRTLEKVQLRKLTTNGRDDQRLLWLCNTLFVFEHLVNVETEVAFYTFTSSRAISNYLVGLSSVPQQTVSDLFVACKAILHEPWKALPTPLGWADTSV